ncbi:BspA family leucine-rich repeat surface protein [Mariniflexile sp. HNIBRBA6329]|uniref:BspA family leucine-rich repeat surface protein n=1 Tax=Mariniflexile sp. HNIBRBA6329 TaxID=3373088 RepID=UPI003746EDB9
MPADVGAECGSGLDPDNTGMATATDSCDADPVITLSDVNNGSFVTRTWKATDASGNETTGEQIITIIDNTPPATPVLATLVGETSVTAVTPTTTDACSGTITGTTSDPTVYTEQGVYTITWSFDDGNSNTTTADQKVIVDNGLNMKLEFNTSLSSGTTITLPLNGNVDVTVNWGDGNIENTAVAANFTHTYSSEGTYTVFISGSLTHFGSNNYPNADKLTKVTSFGSLGITDLSYAFHNAKNLTEVPSALPADVTNTSYMFYFAETFNQDLNNWDVSKVTNMDYMFSMAYDFNGNISGWDVGQVTTMRRMFRYATVFNQDLNNWDVSKVANMAQLFEDAVLFNGNIRNWDVSSVQNMYSMFSYAKKFNQDIGNWNVSKVTDMSWMFYEADAFTQDLNNWNVSNVTTLEGMFSDTDLFNGNIDNWDVSKVTDMVELFYGSLAFNRDISGWNVSKVTDMSYMFAYTENFNQDISSWDVSNVTNMYRMFVLAIAFDQNISNWNVSKVTSMHAMFDHATSFDQDISSWDVSSVTDMSFMFYGTALSTVNYDALLNAWSNLMLKSNVSFHGGNSTYSCLSEAARTNIKNNFNWNINDAGLFSDDVGISVQPASSTSVNENTPDIELSVGASGEVALSYQWYKDDLAITSNGDSSSLIIPTLPANSGTYHCVVTSACGASEQSADAVVDIMGTTLNNPTSEESPITIYPNPVSDKLYIEIKTNAIQKVTIWNLEGKQLIQKSNDSISGLLDVSFLESGVYIMNIQTNDKIIITKIIKE